MTQDVRLRFEETNLPVLVNRVCRWYQHIADKKNIQLRYDTVGEIPEVGTDRVAVAAVLDNLLSNAIKYSPRGKPIRVQVQSTGDGVVCSVQDEGPGLSEEEQRRLFQRGVRLSPIPTGGEPSTGYGLAVAKELIQRLHGEIWCTSTQGRGACFSFRLPVSHASGPEPHKALRSQTGDRETT
jgi:signal transduction histidine kinase